MYVQMREQQPFFNEFWGHGIVEVHDDQLQIVWSTFIVCIWQPFRDNLGYWGAAMRGPSVTIECWQLKCLIRAECVCVAATHVASGYTRLCQNEQAGCSWTAAPDVRFWPSKIMALEHTLILCPPPVLCCSCSTLKAVYAVWNHCPSVLCSCSSYWYRPAHLDLIANTIDYWYSSAAIIHQRGIISMEICCWCDREPKPAFSTSVQLLLIAVPSLCALNLANSYAAYMLHRNKRPRNQLICVSFKEAPPRPWRSVSYPNPASICRS